MRVYMKGWAGEEIQWGGEDENKMMSAGGGGGGVVHHIFISVRQIVRLININDSIDTCKKNL